MANIIVVGAQWGDEGKAKIVDLLAEQADVVIRCQGGCNAGHTVAHEGRVFKFHLVPSGILYPNKLCIIGPGTVISPWVLLDEIAQLQAQGIDTQQLKISDRAHLTLPYHVDQDQFQERTASQQSKIGTTGKGIGPTYMDKVGRIGLRMGELLLETEHLKGRLAQIFESKGFQLDTLDDLMASVLPLVEQLKPYVTDTIPLVHESIAQKRQLLFEGAQGTMLDVDYGTYPYVTSSNATAGGACTGSGVGPSQIDHVIGVMKTYITRVGEGPLPTEEHGAMGEYLQQTGQEFGTTTGRLRRCGWFDAVVGRYSTLVNGLDSLAITKLDVLDTLETILVCTAYRHRVTGELLTLFPAQLESLADCEPVYESLPGWKTDTTQVRQWEDLPKAAQAYLKRLEVLCGVPISLISVGPERDQTITLNTLLDKRSLLLSH